MTKNSNTHTDWEREIKDMLNDAGLKPIHFMLNNSGVRILNRIRKELADARREVIDAIQMVLDYAKQDVEMADDPDDPRVRIKYLEHKLASLKEGGKEK